MEDLQSKFIAGVISLVLAAAAWLKSHTEVKDIKADREKTKNERDTKIALLEQKVEMLEVQRKEDAERYEKQLLDIVSRFEKRLEEGSVSYSIRKACWRYSRSPFRLQTSNFKHQNSSLPSTVCRTQATWERLSALPTGLALTR